MAPFLEATRNEVRSLRGIVSQLSKFALRKKYSDFYILAKLRTYSELARTAIEGATRILNLAPSWMQVPNVSVSDQPSLAKALDHHALSLPAYNLYGEAFLNLLHSNVRSGPRCAGVL